jgi:hypothetical protein
MEGNHFAGPKKTKPIKANIPASGRKSEILSSKSETAEFNRAQFEKTKPIFWVKN